MSGLSGYLGGFVVTFKKLFEKRVTIPYPKKKRPKPPRAHGRHVLNKYPDGMEKCIGCELCAGVCPANCIFVRGLDNPPGDPVSPGERYGYVYEINYLRCIHCDLCVEACPTEAITETKLFEFSFASRDEAIYTRDELLVDEEGMPKRLPWEDWRPGDDTHTSGWMRATAPSGDGDFTGGVAWSPELGFGVRPSEDSVESPRQNPMESAGESAREQTRPTEKDSSVAPEAPTTRPEPPAEPPPSSPPSPADKKQEPREGGH